MSEQTLAQELDALAKYGAIKNEIPSFIRDNLDPQKKLRPYQEEALRRFFFYINDYEDRLKPTHLLFYMATGSGKTLIMAANILYLYSLGYRNFLFFVNSTEIIEKTKDNFLNPQSIKYLFSQNIKFIDKSVNVVEQSNFQHVKADDINIVFNTIQGLHYDLTHPKENGLTFEDFEERKTVLIADEAHHINSMTKKSLNQTEIEVEGTWENTVQRIFESNKENILLEFTATVDMEHIKIREKYEPKLIYQYTLKEFREDKYSKEVKVLESDTDNLQRAVQAMIISQYRRKVAQDNGVYLKPVILFKSKTIKESEDFEEEFHNYLGKLKPKDLEQIAKKNNGILAKAFDYFDAKSISLGNLVKEFQEEFSRDKCISVNSKNESEEKQVLVNTLEDKNNEIRAVFAVDKLNEGWDVLNLFDIVRLYDTRDSKGSKIGKTTLSEAQLIGRGARYYPFRLDDEQEMFKRKYDEDLDNDLRILEELYYHSTYNPKYIWELNQALIQTGIKAQEEKEIDLKIKEAFKNSPFWKSGIIYLNSRIENKNEDKEGIDDYGVFELYKYDLNTGFSRETAIFDFYLQQNQEIKTKTYKLEDLGRNVLQKAIDKVDFFSFSNLQAYVPQYKSLLNFIDEICEIQVEVKGNELQVEDLSQEDKLDIAVHVLSAIRTMVEKESKEYRGTKTFNAHGVSTIFADKVLKINKDEDSDKEVGNSMNTNLNPEFQLNLFEKDWYIYEDDFGTSEEKYFVKFVNTALEKLAERYEDIYLARNANVFKIYDFVDGKAFEPDYVLFLKEKESSKRLYYQLFIEPKGAHLLKTDEWKEEFLEEISIQAEPEIVHADREYSLIGLPFFNEEVKKMEFAEAFEESIE